MSADRSVTLVTRSMRLSGGVLVLVHYANGLVARGYRVDFVTSAGGAEPEVQDKLSPHIRVHAADLTIEQAANLGGKARLSWQMAQQVPRCDTILATHTPTVVPTLLARHLLRRGRRAVWFHQDHPDTFEGRPIEKWLLRHAARWFERVITVSEVNRREIERTSGVAARVVPQGYSLSTAEEVPEQAAPLPGTKTILYIGDRRPRKGWGDFLAAAELLYRHHPDLSLAIVTKEAGTVDTLVPHDIYLRPSWTELVRLYCSCRVFVSASWLDSFGRPPLEAMACGTPVVTTDSQGVREYAKDGINCLMTPIQDPAALAAAIDRVLSDETLARRLAWAGRQTALEFTWERAVASFVEALEADQCL